MGKEAVRRKPYGQRGGPPETWRITMEEDLKTKGWSWGEARKLESLSLRYVSNRYIKY